MPSAAAPNAGTPPSRERLEERTFVPGEQAALRRRSLRRAAAGGAILLAVAALHLLRARGGSPLEPIVPAPAPLGVPTPLPPRLVAEKALPPPELSLSYPDPGSAPASLRLDFEHSIQSGTLLVSVDGEPVLERPIQARVYKKVLFVKLRRGRVQEAVEVGPGERRVRVDVVSKDGRLSETIVGTFAAGGERTLRIRVTGQYDGLSLEWQ